ncbi:unnamed protein product [Trichogramma brassicae]|uniref:C2H2-type domain-containing protein n=1 Tax=Trichogramma brassicae TaxID=86971 RepID=A0A6H5IYX0_9HYME|nr:unnamed protein product [Trichogramma brassicae]
MKSYPKSLSVKNPALPLLRLKNNPNPDKSRCARRSTACKSNPIVFAHGSLDIRCTLARLTLYKCSTNTYGKGSDPRIDLCACFTRREESLYEITPRIHVRNFPFNDLRRHALMQPSRRVFQVPMYVMFARCKITSSRARTNSAKRLDARGAFSDAQLQSREQTLRAYGGHGDVHQKIIHEGRKDYACHNCEKKFGDRSSLIRHSKIVHEGRENYVCDKCEQKFGQKVHLIRHQKIIHEGRKDYACDKCEKKFGQKPHLLIHQKTVHEGRKDYACDKCEKKFGVVHSLRVHQSTIHDGRKNYACNDCEKKFVKEMVLIRHQKTVHEGCKDHACDRCEKKFGQNSDLIRHQQIIHEGHKDYPCNNCGSGVRVVIVQWKRHRRHDKAITRVGVSKSQRASGNMLRYTYSSYSLCVALCGICVARFTKMGLHIESCIVRVKLLLWLLAPRNHRMHILYCKVRVYVWLKKNRIMLGPMQVTIIISIRDAPAAAALSIWPSSSSPRTSASPARISCAARNSTIYPHREQHLVAVLEKSIAEPLSRAEVVRDVRRYSWTICPVKKCRLHANSLKEEIVLTRFRAREYQTAVRDLLDTFCNLNRLVDYVYYPLEPAEYWWQLEEQLSQELNGIDVIFGNLLAPVVILVEQVEDQPGVHRQHDEMQR